MLDDVVDPIRVAPVENPAQRWRQKVDLHLVLWGKLGIRQHGVLEAVLIPGGGIAGLLGNPAVQEQSSPGVSFSRIVPLMMLVAW